MEQSMNCWTHMKCGREHGGARVEEMGVCPASPNHGEVCWRVAGTLCGGVTCGAFAEKIDMCFKCDFFDKTLCGDFVRDQVSAG